MTIEMNGATLDANGLRGFFIYGGEQGSTRITVQISDGTIENALAKGGEGGWGGGGAGMGGAVFIGADADVTLSNMEFAGNGAEGGDASDGRSGGGGLGGNASQAENNTGSGGGGVGTLADGASQNSAGGDGILIGLMPGGDGVELSRGGGQGGGGGIGADAWGTKGGGGGGGVGGIDGGTGRDGGQGGFGGGGGGATNSGGRFEGGDGGFGGGGGSGIFTEAGGQGGYGGGGGASGVPDLGQEPGSGGFGGGDGRGEGNNNSVGLGGGGAGMGGAIFVMEGGTLSIDSNGSISESVVAAGESRNAEDGEAFGKGIYLQGSGILRLGAGTISDEIVDEWGVIEGGYAEPEGFSPGQWSVLVDAGPEGTLMMSGTHHYTGGTTVQSGTLLLNGSIAGLITTVETGAVLGGDGTLGPIKIDDGGTFAPGNSAGIMTVEGNVVFDRGATLEIELGGASAGTYDQIALNGAVALNEATLDVRTIDGFDPLAAGASSFTIIENDGDEDISGMFEDLAEGDVVTLDAMAFSISYSGGDGNDVVLTALLPPTVANDQATVDEGATLVVSDAATGVLANDADPDGGALIVSQVGGDAADVGTAVIGAFGTLILNADGTYSYRADQPAAEALGTGDTGTDTFTYQVADESGLTATADLVITVNGQTPEPPPGPSNRQPVARDDAATAIAGASVTVSQGDGVLANDTDADGDSLRIVAVNGAAGDVGTAIVGTFGTLTLQADGRYTYRADQAAAAELEPGETGTESFRYTISDGEGGTATADLIIAVSGQPNVPVLVGDGADDVFDNPPLPSIVDGAGGTDRIVLDGTFSEYTLTPVDGGFELVRADQPTDVLSFSNVETLEFGDVTLVRNDGGLAAEIYALYQTVFNREPDLGGLSFWIDTAEAGTTIGSITTGFLFSEEFVAIYGADPSDASLLEGLYQNVFNRMPDPDGWVYWLQQLDEGLPKESLVLGFANSAELMGLIDQAIDDGLFVIA